MECCPLVRDIACHLAVVPIYLGNAEREEKKEANAGRIHDGGGFWLGSFGYSRVYMKEIWYATVC